MLILSRKRGEAIRIGNDGVITIKVLANSGGQVRFGIDAPKEVLIYRDEIFERIQQQKAIEQESK